MCSRLATACRMLGCRGPETEGTRVAFCLSLCQREASRVGVDGGPPLGQREWLRAR